MKKNITYIDFNRNLYKNIDNEELYQNWVIKRSGTNTYTNKQKLICWELNHRITNSPYIDQDIESELFQLRFGGQIEENKRITFNSLINRNK